MFIGSLCPRHVQIKEQDEEDKITVTFFIHLEVLSTVASVYRIHNFVNLGHTLFCGFI